MAKNETRNKTEEDQTTDEVPSTVKAHYDKRNARRDIAYRNARGEKATKQK